ncbi:DUF222 domain-containing protein [Pseudonocardia nantongensis]|uniref:DUF222 domain-containing protein n=1 Tax=Pseudonocardia nantongensis TaxID=1181885 RepID=UPI00397D9B70
MINYTGPSAGEPGFPQVDLALMQVAVEQAAADGAGSLSESELIDQVRPSPCRTLWRRCRPAASARSPAHVGARIAAGVLDLDKLERAVAAQIGLACRVSPTEARTRVRTARDLHDGLDRVRALFVAGELSRDKVAAIATATADLDTRQRGAVDARLAAHDLSRLGIGRLRDLVRMLVAEIAPQKFRSRVDAARAGRRVTLLQAPDAMTYLTAYLPLEQGVACLAALQKAFTEVSVDPAPLTRTRGQVMADTLAERVTGTAIATDVDVEVQVLVPVEALIDPHSPLPAEIPGHGPVPLDRALLRCAGTTPRPHRPRRRRRTHPTRQRPRHLRVPQPRPRTTRMDRPPHTRWRPHHDTHRAHLPRPRGST